MTREEAENAIMGKCKEIADIVKGFSPDNKYFEICIMDCNRATFYNDYWESREVLKVPFTRFDGGEND